MNALCVWRLVLCLHHGNARNWSCQKACWGGCGMAVPFAPVNDWRLNGWQRGSGIDEVCTRAKGNC